jgi:hypothetical protein
MHPDLDMCQLSTAANTLFERKPEQLEILLPAAPPESKTSEIPKGMNL